MSGSLQQREPVGEPDILCECRVCGSDTTAVGSKYSAFSNRDFHLRRCDRRRYAFISDPRTDFDALYNDHYYRGMGADPLVNYVAEMDDPSTVRRYEWRGILAAVSALTTVDSTTRWLDYGCGTGGLVRFVRAHGARSTQGFEQGWSAAQLRRRGTTICGPKTFQGAKDHSIS